MLAVKRSPPSFIMLMRYLRKVEHIKHLKVSAAEDPSSHSTYLRMHPETNWLPQKFYYCSQVIIGQAAAAALTFYLRRNFS